MFRGYVNLWQRFASLLGSCSRGVTYVQCIFRPRGPCRCFQCPMLLLHSPSSLVRAHVRVRAVTARIHPAACHPQWPSPCPTWPCDDNPPTVNLEPRFQPNIITQRYRQHFSPVSCQKKKKNSSCISQTDIWPSPTLHPGRTDSLSCFRRLFLGDIGNQDTKTSRFGPSSPATAVRLPTHTCAISSTA